VHGQLKHARELYKAVEEKSRRMELSESALSAISGESLLEALAQNRAEAIRGADALMKQSQTPTVVLNAADIYARAGEDAKAAQLIERAAPQRPDDLNIQSVQLPGLRALLAMNHHDGKTAVDLMAKAETYDRAILESRYTRGCALLMAGRPDEAAKEFQAVLGLRNFGPTDPTTAFSQLGLARAYAAANDKEKARTAYQDFFALWDKADPDVPVLKQARTEYAKLQ